MNWPDSVGSEVKSCARCQESNDSAALDRNNPTNQANQQIAAQTSAYNLASAREATAATEGMHERGIAATERMSSSALSQARTQFDDSQAFNERMSSTAYQRGVA